MHILSLTPKKYDVADEENARVIEIVEGNKGGRKCGWVLS
jgi:hypothetical protein